MAQRVTFVWLPTMTGKPAAQKWYGDMKTIKEAVKPIYAVVLPPEEAELSLDKLMMLYPAPPPLLDKMTQVIISLPPGS